MRKQILNINVMIFYVFLILCAGCTQRMNRTAGRPAGRGYHAMAYDAESRRVILYGGQTGNIAEHSEIFTSSETWAFDLARNRWQKMEPESHPPAMSAHAMAYDSESDRVILHGGGGIFDGIFEMERLEDYVLNQTWAYDFNNDIWMKMSDGPPRLGHRLAYDGESDRIIMFSGACFRGDRFQDVQETWVYDFNSDRWTEMKPARSPAARHYYGLAYDTESDRVILWGGFIGKDVLDPNIWTYDFNTNTWLEHTNTRLELIPESGPDSRWYQAMAYDETSDRIIVYGGADEGSDEMWAYGFSDNTWTKLRPTINPGKISRMPMVYVPDAGKLVLFGGQLDSRQYTYSDATWLYNLNTGSWNDVTVRWGEYFGQNKPGIIPEVFAPGIVSTVYLEHSPVAFSPDCKEAYWTSDFREFGTTEGRIFFSTQKNGKWTSPQVAPFSENLNCFNPVFSNDGSALYFFAQPVEEGKEPAPHIYRIERKKSGWSKPRVVEIPGIKGYLMTQFSLTKNGTLYFSTDSEDSHGSFDIFRSRLVDGRYTEPENLGDAINGKYWDSYPYIDPEERFFIFTSIDRPDGYGGMDMYISFRMEDGPWTRAVNMGDRINTKGVDALANCSPDGKWMFFVSDRNGNVDVYWVDARIIDELKRH